MRKTIEEHNLIRSDPRPFIKRLGLDILSDKRSHVCVCIGNDMLLISEQDIPLRAWGAFINYVKNVMLERKRCYSVVPNEFMGKRYSPSEKVSMDKFLIKANSLVESYYAGFQEIK